jgi:2,3-dihydroxybenzoate-AMP ligase
MTLIVRRGLERDFGLGIPASALWEHPTVAAVAEHLGGLLEPVTPDPEEVVMTRPGTVPWPPEFAERYAAAGYWHGRPLGAHLWAWADAHGDRTAVVDGDTRLSYRQLAERSDALAANLKALGLRPGDNILVQLPNSWEFVAVFFACQRLGVAPLLALMPHREHELGHLGDLVGATAIVTVDRWQGTDHQDLAARLVKETDRSCRVLIVGDEVRQDDGHVDLRPMLVPRKDPAALRRRLDAAAPAASEVALFLLSGGTTGVPKAIARTHDDYAYNAEASAAACGFGPDTVYLAVLPMAHNFPLASPGVLGTLANGGTVVTVPSPNPDVAFPAIAAHGVTVTSVVPAIARRWMEAAATRRDELAGLRTVQIGGSVLPPEFAARIGPALGCTLQQVYGMAEGLLNYTRPDDPPEVVLTTQGRPVSPADEVRIVDPDGAEVPAGEPGELLTRGPYTPRGYFAAPEHNRRAYTPDGWFRTGDIVRRHPSGNLVVSGRIKDVVNRGGEKISAEEVEALVEALPAVRQAAVVPVPDPELGEQIGVAVVLHPGQTLTLTELREEIERGGVAGFKLPQRLTVVTALPLTGVGKVDKPALLARFAAEAGDV